MYIIKALKRGFYSMIYRLRFVPFDSQKCFFFLFSQEKEMSNPFILENLRHLTKADKDRVPQEYIDDVDLDWRKETDESLKGKDYVIGELIYNGETYTLVHGFPGDNAVGVICDKNRYVVGILGEGCEDYNEFTHWYLSFACTRTKLKNPRSCSKRENVVSTTDC